MLVVAHVAHWAETILILVPTLGFIVWLAAITIRDRRRQRSGEEV